MKYENLDKASHTVAYKASRQELKLRDNPLIQHPTLLVKMYSLLILFMKSF